MRPAFQLAIGQECPNWDGVIPFPWTAAPAAAANLAGGPAQLCTVDLFRVPCEVPDVVLIGIRPLGAADTVHPLSKHASPACSFSLTLLALSAALSQLLVDVDAFGQTVKLTVQRKLKSEWQRATPIAGPGHLQHQVGEHQIEESPPIPMPRPLARSGTHSYLVAGTGDGGPSSMAYEETLTQSDLQQRGDLVACPEHSGVELRLHLEPLPPQANTGQKRKAALNGTGQVSHALPRVDRR